MKCEYFILLIITDGIITDISHNSNHSDDTVIDANGKYLIPGVIDKSDSFLVTKPNSWGEHTTPSIPADSAKFNIASTWFVRFLLKISRIFKHVRDLESLKDIIKVNLKYIIRKLL